MLHSDSRASISELIESPYKDACGIGSAFKTTPDHPIFVSGKGWTRAANLAPGVRVTSAGNPGQTVSSVKAEAGTISVYNLNVERSHSYFVGTQAANTWVHNKCVIPEGGVYVLKDGEGVVKYVGSTNNFGRRMGEWRKRMDEFELTFERITPIANKTERLLEEQRLIEKTGLENLLNVRNAISKSNPLYQRL